MVRAKGAGVDGGLGKDDELAVGVEGRKEREDARRQAREVIVGDHAGVREVVGVCEKGAEAEGVIVLVEATSDATEHAEGRAGKVAEEGPGGLEHGEAAYDV